MLPVAPSERLRNLLIIADDRIKKKKEMLGGLVCCSILEAYILEVRNKFKINYEGTKTNREQLEHFHNIEKIIDDETYAKLKKINKLRNSIIHLVDAKKEKRDDLSLIIDDCKEIVDDVKSLFHVGNNYDYEEVADAEADLFPNIWVTPCGVLPAKIKAEYFTNLITAQSEYVAPLGKFLQENCLKHLDGDNPLGLKFGDLSRVNATSGYVWMSAVPETKRRSRVKLPGLTVLFMPHEIAVYVEFPGKSHKYKKIYYNNFLMKGEIDKYLLPMKERNFEFFHTWWYAMREPIGSVAEYMQNPQAKKKEWDITGKAQYILRKINNQEKIFTQNFFLVGKGYSRKDILTTNLNLSLHEEIAKDIELLYPLLKAVLA